MKGRERKKERGRNEGGGGGRGNGRDSMYKHSIVLFSDVGPTTVSGIMSVLQGFLV